jgi:hypothetical protein
MRYLFLLLAFWAWWMEYPKVAFQDPSGIHFIRQTDGLAFASYYFETNNSFLESGTLNQSSAEGRVACELPVFYYLTAKIYAYTGIYFPILRWLHGIVVLLGIMHVFLFLKHWSKSNLMSLTLMLMLLTSVVFSYYAFNFLPDAPAWSLVWMGWFYAFRLTENWNRKWLLLSLFFFLFGALLKPTFFIHAVAAAGMWLWGRKELKWGMKNWLQIGVIFSIALLLIAGWSLHIIQYNAANHDDYFLVSTRPIWKMDAEDIRVVWDHMTGYWFRDYLAKDAWRVLLGMLILIAFRWKKMNLHLRNAVWILTLGELAYIVLFFGQFKDHDYYIWNIFPWLILIMAAFVNSFWEALSEGILKQVVGIALLIFMMTSWRSNEKVIRWRFAHEEPNLAWVGKRLKNGPDILKQAGILPFTEKVVVVPDFTRNGSLLFLQQEGWTIADSTQLSKLEQPDLKQATCMVVLDGHYLNFPEIKSDWKIIQSDSVNQIYILRRY